MQDNTHAVPVEVYEWLNARFDAVQSDQMDPFTACMLEEACRGRGSEFFSSENPVGDFGEWLAATPARLLSFGWDVIPRLRSEQPNSEIPDDACIDHRLLDDLRIVQILEQGGLDALSGHFLEGLQMALAVEDGVTERRVWLAKLQRVIHVCPTLTMAMRIRTSTQTITTPLPYAEGLGPYHAYVSDVGEVSFPQPCTGTGWFMTALDGEVMELTFLSASEFPMVELSSSGGESTGIHRRRRREAVRYYLQFRGFGHAREEDVPPGMLVHD